MTSWPRYPLIYEINTWVWLDELSRKRQKAFTLASIPEEEWDRVASFGFDAVWFMGVWERSPKGIEISMANPELLADFQRALPDFTARDNVGSPYCVRRYTVDAHLGGSEALAVARDKLAQRGLRLILDFVPNHVAPDHPWVDEHPEYFIQGNADDAKADSRAFATVGSRVFACGRDPYFPAWPDVLQLNAFEEGLRAATIETLLDIAEQCDGVRCDMAMLLINSVFQRTWGSRCGPHPETDYWPQIISSVKHKHPAFFFIAEAYWDLEWELQQQGFDYCYDKRLYDRLEHDSAQHVRLHLCAKLPYQEKLLRFIENHDEPRAATTFPSARNRAAVLTVLTLPGARLIHEGQMEGRQVRLPVFLARRPAEPEDPGIQLFYQTLFTALRANGSFQGKWLLCDCSGWADNSSYLNLVGWCWQQTVSRCLIVVNLSGIPSQGRTKIPWDDLRGRSWQLRDVFTATVYERDGNEMVEAGLFVDLPPWGFHFLEWLQGGRAESEIQS